MSQGCNEGSCRNVLASRKMLIRRRGLARGGAAAGVCMVCRREARKVRRRPRPREASVSSASSAGGIRSGA